MIEFVASTTDDFYFANSYLAVDDANFLIEKLGKAQNWIDLEDESKQMILIESSFAIDGLMSYDSYPIRTDQLLKFPRVNEKKSYVIPIAIKLATIGFIQKIINKDNFQAIKRKKTSKLEIEYVVSSFSKQLKENSEVMILLKPFRKKMVDLKYGF